MSRDNPVDRRISHAAGNVKGSVIGAIEQEEVIREIISIDDISDIPKAVSGPVTRNALIDESERFSLSGTRIC